MRACVFCEIIAGRKAAGVVHADDSVVVILDHKPATVGHVLVIPRVHMTGLAEADDAVGTAIWRALDEDAALIREALAR
jgi:diadenosine tetraphosphate (Ap4A) HIT family hydrolase